MCEPYPTHTGRAWGTGAMEPLEKDNQLGALLPVPKQQLAVAEEKRPGQNGIKLHHGVHLDRRIVGRIL